MRSSNQVTLDLDDLGFSPLTWENSVSEGQGLPIAHANEIALTTAFVLGGAR
jgi:hypothetical protein